MEKTYYLSKEQFIIAKAEWKKLPREAWQIILYNILRGKDARCGFQERKKNIQGNDPWYSFTTALSSAKWKLRKPEIFKQTFGIDMPEDFLEKL